MRYLAEPLNAPIVRRASQFFIDHPPAKNDFHIYVGPTTNWRTVAKLAVRKSSGCLRIGLFARGTHDLLEIPQCQAHHRKINSAVQIIQKQCRRLHIVPYCESTGVGCLKYAMINVERSTGRQQVTLVWNETDDSEANSSPLLRKLCKALIQVSKNKDQEGLEMHSLWVHYNRNTKYDNSIVDRAGRWEQEYGENDTVIERLSIDADHLNVPLYFPPQVFRQANIDAFSKIIVAIRAWIGNRLLAEDIRMRRVLELYGGVGTIGLHLIDIVGESFVSSDENPHNKSCFERSVATLHVEPPSLRCDNICYEAKNAAAMVAEETSELLRADLVVVDPPRKGLDEEVLDAFCDRRQCPMLHSLVYVSCGFDAFCRDFAKLSGAGWKLDHAEGHLLFPGSDAIETVAFFTRSVTSAY